MDSNIFNLLDDDADVPRSIQQRIRDISVDRTGIDKDEILTKSKKIAGKKNKTKRLGKQQQFKAQAKAEKKRKRSLLKVRSKSTY
jgi:hypothetical protein